MGISFNQSLHIYFSTFIRIVKTFEVNVLAHFWTIKAILAKFLSLFKSSSFGVILTTIKIIKRKQSLIVVRWIKLILSTKGFPAGHDRKQGRSRCQHRKSCRTRWHQQTGWLRHHHHQDYNHCCAKVDYCSSKFAAVGLDEAFRVELAVQVNAQLPFKLDIFNQHYAMVAFIIFFFSNRLTTGSQRLHQDDCCVSLLHLDGHVFWSLRNNIFYESRWSLRKVSSRSWFHFPHGRARSSQSWSLSMSRTRQWPAHWRTGFFLSLAATIMRVVVLLVVCLWCQPSWLPFVVYHLPLGRYPENQNGNLRWHLPWGGGGLEGVSFAIKLFWKTIFLKTI